jgi:hypothetical protein
MQVCRTLIQDTKTTENKDSEKPFTTDVVEGPKNPLQSSDVLTEESCLETGTQKRLH